QLLFHRGRPHEDLRINYRESYSTIFKLASDMQTNTGEAHLPNRAFLYRKNAGSRVTKQRKAGALRGVEIRQRGRASLCRVGERFSKSSAQIHPTCSCRCW